MEFDPTRFPLVKMLVTNRLKVVWCMRLNRAQNDEEHAHIQVRAKHLHYSTVGWHSTAGFCTHKSKSSVWWLDITVWQIHACVKFCTSGISLPAVLPASSAWQTDLLTQEAVGSQTRRNMAAHSLKEFQCVRQAQPGLGATTAGMLLKLPGAQLHVFRPPSLPPLPVQQYSWCSGRPPLLR